MEEEPDEVEIFKHSKFVILAKELIKYCDGIYDLDILKDAVTNSDQTVKDYDWKNRRASNPTEEELNAVQQSLRRKVINSHCLDKETGYRIYGENYHEFVTSSLNTKISPHIVNSKILLRRRLGNYNSPNRLERELNEMLLDEMYKCFVDQNKELINKQINV
jgi:hypothetical protein